MARILQVIERNRAEKLLRFLNFIIDMVVFYVFAVIVLIALQFSGLYNIDEVGDDKATDLKFRLISTIVYGFFMFALEVLTKGRSIGKFITGTRVVKIDGTPIETLDYLKRNLSRIVPFDQLSFLGNNGWHDSWSDTRVVKKKRFEEELRNHNELESIGRSDL